MTRDEFMDTIEKKMQELLSFQHSSITDLIVQAYMEGQRNAGVDQVLELVQEALSRMETPETVSAEPERCSCWHAIPTGLKREEGTFEYRCWGTPEQSICTCGGDKSRCDFYGG